MGVPVYYRSRRGQVFRVLRADEATQGGARYVLRAFPVGLATSSSRGCVAEAAHERSVEDLRDALQRRIEVSSAERTFERLWQNLRLDLESL